MLKNIPNLVPEAKSYKLSFYRSEVLGMMPDSVAVRANCLYWPAISLTFSGSAWGHDYLSKYYYKNVVFACELSVTAIYNGGLDTGGQMYVYMCASDSVSAEPMHPIDGFHAKKCSGLYTIKLMPQIVGHSVQLKKLMVVRDLLEVTDIMDSIDLHGGPSSNPSRRAFMYFGQGLTNDNAGNAQISYTYHMKFYCRYFLPILGSVMGGHAHDVALKRAEDDARAAF